MYSKYIFSIPFLLFCMLSCNDPEYVCNDPDADLNAPAYFDVNDLYQQYCCFWKPSNGWVGDPMPFYENGKYHVFYLHDARDGAPTFHPWAMASTTDFRTYQDHGEVIACGEDDSQEDALGTGSVFKVGNTYYAYYTGHNGNLAPAEKIYLATSTDLQNWTKQSNFEMQAPEGYDANEFRDPLILEENGVYKMLVSSRGYVAQVNDWQAVIMQYSSTDMINWTLEEPFYYNSERILECPDVFIMGGYQYLIYSNWDWANVNRRVLYRYRAVGSKEWIVPQNDDLDQFAYYAGKTAGDGKNRYLFGWCPTRTGNNDDTPYSWAGSLVVHQLISNSDGTLRVIVPDKLVNAGTVAYPKVVKLQNVIVKDNNYDLSHANSLVIFDRENSPTLISTVIKAGYSGKFGFMLGAGGNCLNTHRLSFDTETNMLRLEKWVNGALSVIQAQIPLALSLDKDIDIKILLENAVCVVYINNERAFSNRIYQMSHNPWGLYSLEGKAVFSDLCIQRL